MQLVHLVVLSAVIVPQIPGDCPPQCDCKWKSGKESVICINGNLTRIPAQLDSGTQLLDLTGNQLTAITRDALSAAGLLNLQKVYLAKCRIKLLDRYAFRKLINLVELDLSYNAISAVPSHVFDSISELRELKLSGNPIQRILNDAFVNVPQLVKLELSDCKLGTIEPRAFSGLEHTLEWLKLDKNKISEVRPATLTSLLNLHGLELANNPWNCSCALRPLRQWMLSQNIPSGVPASCRNPPRLAGRTWDRLEDDEFACAPCVESAQGGNRVEAAEGANVSMVCQVTGSPEPAVKWIWKNRPIANVSSPNHKKMYLLHYVDSKSTLTIIAVEPTDGGIYLCSATNKAGRAEVNVTLSVAKRAPDSRLPGGRVLFAVVVVASVFGAASCLLYCLLSQPRKEPRASVNRQESYEKIEMNKKSTESRYSDVSVLSKVHPKMNEYRGVPSGEEADGDDEGGTPTSQTSDNPRRQPNRLIKDRSPGEQLYLASGGLGVQQHILRKATIPSGSLYTTSTTADDIAASSAKNYPDLVVGDPHPTASATLPRCYGGSKGGCWQGGGAVSSSQSPLLARAGPPNGSSRCPSRRLSIDSRSSSSYYRLSQAAVGCEQRSASSLSLCQYGSEPQHHHPASLHHQQLQSSWRTHRHHPSLPASPVHDRSPTHIGRSSTTETPILNPLGVSAEMAAMSYDYHAAQLERFLEEYRSLQQQLSRMKENLRPSASGHQSGKSQYMSSRTDPSSPPYWNTGSSSLFNDIYQS